MVAWLAWLFYDETHEVDMWLESVGRGACQKLNFSHTTCRKKETVRSLFLYENSTAKSM